MLRRLYRYRLALSSSVPRSVRRISIARIEIIRTRSECLYTACPRHVGGRKEISNITKNYRGTSKKIGDFFEANTYSLGVPSGGTLFQSPTELTLTALPIILPVVASTITNKYRITRGKMGMFDRNSRLTVFLTVSVR